uniref:Ig-like domain-containing protein n=1 Tax=Mastacembelus armatus TaxID=205130 RepID=A0A7N8WNU4_9TELE
MSVTHFYTEELRMIRFLFSCVCLGLDVRQSSSDLITKPGDRVQIFCSHDKTDYRVMLWYQRSPGETAMKLIGYLNYKDATMEEQYKKDFNISGDLVRPKEKQWSLTIPSVQEKDEAVYLCAASLHSAVADLRSVTKTHSRDTVYCSDT